MKLKVDHEVDALKEHDRVVLNTPVPSERLMDGIKYLGVVALLAGKPEAGLKRGDVGTVMEVFESNEMKRGNFGSCLLIP